MKSLKYLTIATLLILLLSGCSSTSENPQEVYEAYAAAMNSGDIDTAMSHVASDAMFAVPVGRLYGEEQIRNFMESSSEEVVGSTSENFEVRDNVVICDLEMDFGDFQVAGKVKVTVEDDKIVSYEFSMNPGAFDE